MLSEASINQFVDDEAAAALPLQRVCSEALALLTRCASGIWPLTVARAFRGTSHTILPQSALSSCSCNCVAREHCTPGQYPTSCRPPAEVSVIHLRLALLSSAARRGEQPTIPAFDLTLAGQPQRHLPADEQLTSLAACQGQLLLLCIVLRRGRRQRQQTPAAKQPKPQHRRGQPPNPQQPRHTPGSHSQQDEPVRLSRAEARAALLVATQLAEAVAVPRPAHVDLHLLHDAQRGLLPMAAEVRRLSIQS